jgi:hypothetical protein
MIYCGSGSDSYRENFWFGSGSGSSFSSGSRLIWHSLQQQQFVQKHCFPERWPLILDFLTFVLHFMLDMGSNPVPEPEWILKRN